MPGQKKTVPTEIINMVEERISSDQDIVEMLAEGIIERKDVLIYTLIFMAPKYIMKERTARSGPYGLVDVSDLEDDETSFKYVADLLDLSVDVVRKFYDDYMIKTVEYRNKKMSGSRPDSDSGL